MEHILHTKAGLLQHLMLSNLVKDLTVIVPSGYYYRVRGYHAAKDGSKEAVRTVTKGSPGKIIL